MFALTTAREYKFGREIWRFVLMTTREFKFRLEIWRFALRSWEGKISAFEHIGFCDYPFSRNISADSHSMINTEKIGENFSANKQNRHLHLHIGGKVLTQIWNSGFALTYAAKKVSANGRIWSMHLKARSLWLPFSRNIKAPGLTFTQKHNASRFQLKEELKPARFLSQTNFSKQFRTSCTIPCVLLQRHSMLYYNPRSRE